MKTVAKIVGSLLGLLLLASCTARSGTLESPRSADVLPAPASAAPVVPDPAPERNDRGMVPKQLGEVAGLGESLDNLLVSFSVNSVEVDPKCHEYGYAPDAGRTLLLNVSVSTTADVEAAEELSYVLFASNFSEVGSDGVTRPSQYGGCTEAGASMPSMFGPNQQYAGWIEIVVPEASGILILSDGYGGGWEWAY